MRSILVVVCLTVAAVAGGRDRRHASFRCCNDGFDNSEAHAKVLQVRSECLTDLGLEEKTDVELLKNRENLLCVTECIAKKHELADENGNLLHETLATAIQEHFSVAEWKAPLLEGFIKQCFDDTEETRGKFTPTEEAKCNPEGFDFAYCLWRHFTLACPEDLRDTSDRCVAIREKLMNNELQGDWNQDIDETK